MRIFTKEGLIKELIEIRNKGWIPNARPGNDGGIGNTLEDLLGIEENNLPIPNAAEWELKTQNIKTTSLLTLMHMEPSPRALRFVPSVLLPIYGWPHQGAGTKYPSSEMSFRQTIRSNTRSSRGFSVNVNRLEEKVEIFFDKDSISAEHISWKREMISKGGGNLSPSPYWGFDDLFHKVASKLHNCFYVEANAKKIDGVQHFHYERITLLKGVSKENFISLIEDGAIYIDFDSRTGHNHGTKFRIKKSSIKRLYGTIKEF